ncbi:phospholipid-transporting ATPase ABCA3-like [Haemaphysalis longicornis]
MESVRQFLVLVWKDLYLQRLRERPLAFVAELLLVVVPFVNIHHERGVAGNEAVVNNIIYPVYTPDVLDLNLDTVYYGPNTLYSDTIMATFRRRLPGVAFKVVATEDELVKALFSRNSTANSLGIYFETGALDSGEVPNDLQYTIAFSSGVYHISQARKVTSRSGPSEQQDTMAIRVAAVQSAVDLAHVTELAKNRAVGGRNSTWDETLVKLRQFPFPTYHEDQDNTMFLMGIRWGVAFVWPFCLVITRAIEERRSGMQLFTKLMGVPRTWFWWAHFMCSMVTWCLSSVLVLAIMSMVEGSHGVPFIYRTNPAIVLIAMLLFDAGYIVIGMFISLFFDTPSLGLTCGLILWTVSLLGPFLSLHWRARTVSSYLGVSRLAKLATSLMPIHGLYYIFRIVEFYESYDLTFDLPSIYRPALDRDNVSPFDLMLAMGFSSAVGGTAIWYLEAVLPWTSIVPLPLHFPCMASYWNVIEEEIKVPGSQESSHSDEEGQEYFEEEPRHLLLVLETLDLCKVYRNKFAVDHLSLRLYYGQILALLGHNGAGKTTIASMLSGFLRPTFGTAIIEGFDLIKNHDDSLVNVRICPQRELLYEEMTVYEHLYYFATVQRVSQDSLVEQIEVLVKSLHFGQHLNNFPRTLSGTMKKKLSLAIAIVADPKVLILDEPTEGLDPKSRHEVWDLLQKMRRTCTMLLMTHDMEEADVLGDRIAIIAEGAIRCCGSSQFLKQRFGF